jgi:hydrogenase-4 membrane subunit HyfE
MATTIIEVLAYFMVPIAVGIASSRSLWMMIFLYRLQSLVLVLVTLLIAFEQKSSDFSFIPYLAFLPIPAILWFIIRRLLVAATISNIEEPIQEGSNPPTLQRVQAASTRSKAINILYRRIGPFFHWIASLFKQKDAHIRMKKVQAIWIRQDMSLTRQLFSLTTSFLLVALAYIVALNFNGKAVPNLPPSLVVSIALLMLGIFIMCSRRDIISQVIGLLVMDHGLYIVVIRGVFNQSLLPFFIVSLYCYIFITLVILLFLLPQLHKKSNSIEVEQQNTLKG